MVEIHYQNILNQAPSLLEPLELFEYFIYQLLNHPDLNATAFATETTNLFEQQENYNIYFHTHENKTSFYDSAEKLLLMLLELKLSSDNASLITSSFLEIVDNAFTHNLGKWPSPHYKRVASFKAKYHIKSENEAIELAIKPNTSSRPLDYKQQNMGGNGLFFLQKNIFNGLKARLFIRPANCLCEVVASNQIKLLNDKLPYNYTANVFFELNYA